MPSNAKFIKNTLNIKYNCNICSDEIEQNKVIGLSCNPSKHIFCYECINDWYKELKKKKYYGNYNMLNMCPICRKNGGLLPLIEKVPYIKGLHYIADSKKSEIDIEDDKICGYKLCSKSGFCQAKGNKLYSGLCGIHKNKTGKPVFKQNLDIDTLLDNALESIDNSEKVLTQDSIEEVSEQKHIVNPHKLPKECGVKLKTKDGYCKSKGCKKYGGYCGMHKNTPTNENTVII